MTISRSTSASRDARCVISTSVRPSSCGARRALKSSSERLSIALLGSSRDRDRLPLTAGQCFASFADGQVESVRQTVDEVRYPGNSRRAQYGRIVRARRTEHDVFSHGAVEEHDILRNVADTAPQLCRIELSQLDAVDKHIP